MGARFVQEVNSGVEQDQALVRASEALGYGENLGDGVNIVTLYVEGRGRFEDYLAALGLGFAQEEVFDGEGLTGLGEAEVEVLLADVDEDSAQEEFAQYMLVRSAVDASLTTRCSGIDRAVCLGARGGDPQAELADELRAALVPLALAFPVFGPPPAEEVERTAPGVDPYPEVHAETPRQGKDGDYNTPSTLPPALRPPPEDAKAKAPGAGAAGWSASSCAARGNWTRGRPHPKARPRPRARAPPRSTPARSGRGWTGRRGRAKRRPLASLTCAATRLLVVDPRRTWRAPTRRLRTSTRATPARTTP